MSDDFTLEPMIQPDEGSYMGTVSDIELTVIDMKEGPTEFVRFTFTIPMPEGEPYVCDAIAATKDFRGMGAYGNGRMKLTRWSKALLGDPLPPLNRDNILGAQAVVVLELNADGMLKVADVVAPVKGA